MICYVCVVISLVHLSCHKPTQSPELALIWVFRTNQKLLDTNAVHVCTNSAKIKLNIKDYHKNVCRLCAYTNLTE